MNESLSSLVKNDKTMDLYLIDLPLPVRGFQKFLNCWLIIDHTRDKVILVDTGPASTIPFLEKTLSSLGIDRVDYLLLTHVHLDHGGGAGHFHEKFPLTQVVVSPRGSRHISDPSRLWEGSLATLGRMAEAYGKPIPVPPSVIVDPGQDLLPLKILDTPGHAPHHLSFLYEDLLFAGEAAGVYLSRDLQTGMNVIWREDCLESIMKGLPDYIRPATPPPFQMSTTLLSLGLLNASGASTICYCHYGFSHYPSMMLQSSRSQLLLWEREINCILKEENGSDANHSEDDLIEIGFQRLLKVDLNLRAFEFLVEAVKQREGFFLKNSIRGFMRYLSGK